MSAAPTEPTEPTEPTPPVATPARIEAALAAVKSPDGGASTDDIVIVLKVIRLALLRAFSFLQQTQPHVLALSLSANLFAAHVLNHFGIPYRVITGFCDYPRWRQSVPHVWLETQLGGHTQITDLVWTPLQQLRSVYVLGNSYAMVTESDEGGRAGPAVYGYEPAFPLHPHGQPASLLAEQSANGFARYRANMPPFMHECMRKMLATALDEAHPDVVVATGQ
jgi:hypothetical protein